MLDAKARLQKSIEELTSKYKQKLIVYNVCLFLGPILAQIGYILIVLNSGRGGSIGMVIFGCLLIFMWFIVWAVALMTCETNFSGVAEYVRRQDEIHDLARQVNPRYNIGNELGHETGKAIGYAFLAAFFPFFYLYFMITGKKKLQKSTQEMQETIEFIDKQMQTTSKA